MPSEYKENEYYFAQESISFVKFCRQNNPKNSIDLLADSDIQIRSLHSFDIWMPVIWVAGNILLPIAINLVSDYIKDKLKGREKEDAKVDVTFIVKREDEEKTLHYSGDAIVIDNLRNRFIRRPCGQNPGQGTVRSVLIFVCIRSGSSREETA